jgi:hypothetical protein
MSYIGHHEIRKHQIRIPVIDSYRPQSEDLEMGYWQTLIDLHQNLRMFRGSG